MGAMVVLVIIFGAIALVTTALGLGLNEPLFLQVGYVCGGLVGLLLAITPLCVWGAVNKLREELKQQRGSAQVKPVSRL